MKYCLILFALIALQLQAQTVLKFDKRFVQCEDKWVAHKMNKEDSTYNYGFIYIDAAAGLTYQDVGSFKISEGRFVPKQNDYNSKIRLEINRVKVSWIPESKFEELQVSATPDWLKAYKTDTASIERLYRWGFLYNSWDECEKALTFLEKGQAINPKFKGLEFELAYAYNALERYNNAITVLEGALQTTPNECYLYKELSYAQMHIGQLDKAAVSCKKGIELCSEKPMKCEIAFNLAKQYFLIKDKVNFKSWADEMKKWADTDDFFMNNLKKMEEGLK